MIFFTRVLPISFCTAILLVNFQNCAKPNALTSSGQTVASNPSTSVGGGSNPGDIFQPSTPTPNNGGGGFERNAPDCMRINTQLATPVASDEEKPSDEIMYSVKVTLINYTRNPKGGYSQSFVPFYQGQLIFAHNNGYDYKYEFQTAPEFAVKEAEFLVPASVYKGVLVSGLTGFFTGRKFDYMPVQMCADKGK